ncbi:hypothetical protein ATK36_3196 [Amycolatopsis sulphurea]|uniref:Uncharacterized protein n=1 Tax=Amycolatopsis sulphurea TaxID=76022 RepID=A0A2A9FC40_9PSEU|nr:hypothetical protein [Amycolatopsis sulphurea]PFG48122.1 hypothetical protein ATK36_3196 [Amycolatopsis sulphurea]
MEKPSLGERLAAKARGNVAELIATAGAAAMAVGVGQIYGPAAWLAGGAFGVVGAVCVARSKGGAR